MAIITFVSDYGYKDHYVAAVKARILNHNPKLNIIDISHNIEHFNLAHGSFTLKSVFRDFPAGTVHLAAINDAASKRFVAIEIENHFFVGPDDGLFSLISDHPPTRVVELPSTASTFPALAVLAEAAARLASGEDLEAIGKATPEFQRLLGRQVRATKRQINGHVIRIDGYGNLITNIEKKDFEILSKGIEFTIVFGREKFRWLNQAYTDTEAGDCFVLFNAQNLLEIGINHGNAHELLGLDFDSPVSILFDVP
jgi:S-adenosyl-L-methionine hydrolase (adenosine-forming)